MQSTYCHIVGTYVNVCYCQTVITVATCLEYLRMSEILTAVILDEVAGFSTSNSLSCKAYWFHGRDTARLFLA